jgi:molybdate/tungstate transport system substrate-binding protein
MKIRFFIPLIAALLLAASCSNNKKEKLVIFHAGSLSVPFHDISDAFIKENPNIKVYAEQSGSLAAARKVTELDKSCDVLAVADYIIIDNIMVPDYASWNYIFAANEMIIAFTDKSKYSDEINSNNWHSIILRDEIAIGRSEPNLDPCGYRSIFVFMLAESFYRIQGLANKLKDKKQTIIRPKETDLIAILETGNIDYLMIYKSVAEQHNLRYIELPDEINLSNPELDSLYQSVSITVDGAAKGEKTLIHGSSILYGLSIPHNHQNYDAAIMFINFILNPEKGGRILNEQGMKPVYFYNDIYKNALPKEILKNQ